MSRCVLWRRARTRGSDRGAAAVEFALIMVPLLLIVFGIIGYGFMLSFRQTLSQAATEGARAAAVAPTGTTDAQRTTRAREAIDEAMESVGKSCGSGGLICQIGPSASCEDCWTVTLSYDYGANPVVPSVPLMGELLPDDLEYAATVRES